MTRAFIYLGHGEFAKACALNPLSVPVALLLLAQLIRLVVLATSSRSLRLEVNKRTAIFAILLANVAVVSTWITRLAQY